MRLYLDEDIASKELVNRLSTVHEVVPTLRGEIDRNVWEQAQADGAVVVAMNVKDFMMLAERTPGHHGLLVVYRQNNPQVDMHAADIAAAIGRLVQSLGDDLTDEVQSLNNFRS